MSKLPVLHKFDVIVKFIAKMGKGVAIGNFESCYDILDYFHSKKSNI